MNQEALRQHHEHQAIRQRLWPVAHPVPELVTGKVLETEAEKAARIAAFLQSLADDAMNEAEERRLRGQRRREEAERVKREKALAALLPKWADISDTVDTDKPVKKVIASVLKHYPGVKFSQLLPKDRSYRVATARAYVMYALDRDHSTVWVAVQKVKREIERTTDQGGLF
jgi:chromosomal replication initiation ATPase DnaA